MKIFSTLTLLVLVAFGAFAAPGPPFLPVLRNQVTTNSFTADPPAANDVLTWDGVNKYFTNKAPGSVNATNAIADINGSSSNHQFIVIWTAAETSNTFGIQTAQGLNGGTNFFHFPTSDNTHSGVMSSNVYQQLQTMQVGSVVLSNFIAILGMTNVDALQFVVSNGKLEIISGAVITNLNLRGNTIATNGWIQFGDPVNFFGVTNWNPLVQAGATLLMPTPGSQFIMYQGNLTMVTNSAVLLGGSTDNTTNTLRANPQSFLFDSLNAPSPATEHNAYRFANTTIGSQSNVIVRMRELTNAITSFYTNQTAVDTNSMMFSNGVLYAQRQFGVRNVFYDDFNWPTLYGAQITGRKAYGNEPYYNSGYMSNFNSGGLLQMTANMPGARNFYVAVSNDFIGFHTNWTRFGTTFVPYHGTAAAGGTNSFAAIGLVLSDFGDVNTWAGITNTLHTYFDLINWQLHVEHGCIGCIGGGAGTEAIVTTNLLLNGVSDVQWGQPYFIEYQIFSNRLSINFNGRYIDIYDPRGTNYFYHRVASWELSGDGTNFYNAAFDSIWAGYADDSLITRPVDAGLSVASDFSLIAPESTIINFVSDGMGRMKRIVQGGGMTITDQGTNLILAASGSSPGFMSQNTNIAAQPSVSLWPGTGINIWYTNNTASNRVDYLLESTATGGGAPASELFDIQFYTNGPAFGGMKSFQFNPTNSRVRMNMLAGTWPQLDIEIGGTQPGVRVGGTTSVSTNEYTSVGIFNYGGADFTIYPQFNKGIPANWTFKTNTMVPNSDVYQDLGAPTLRWRTNYNGTVLTTNYFQAGYSVRTAATPTLVGTNLIFDGTNSDYYEVFVRANGTGTGLTNFVFTNIEQFIEVQCWNTNGAAVNLMYDTLNLFTAGQYYDQSVIPVDTNGPTRILVWRTSRGTNVLVQTRSYALAAGSGTTFSTNYVTGVITITGGGGTGAGVVQWQTNNNIVNVGQTNFNLFVYNWVDGLFATNNTASNKVDYALYAKTNFNQANVATMLLSNQVQYIPMEFNGSNGVTATALTNLWNMSSNTFKQVTNFVATNLTFTVSNVVKGESIISSFLGNGSYSNTITILATAGINIKWMNWTTNGSYDILVRPNATYTLQLFSDRDTNVLAWVGTDDALVPINAWWLSASNAVFTNLLIQAGRSTSNAVAGGKMFYSIANATNLPGSTFTNIAGFTVPANTLTNDGDMLIAEWRGRFRAGTNTLNVSYGSITNLINIVLTNLASTYQIQAELTRTGNTNQHVDLRFFLWNVVTQQTTMNWTTNVNLELTETNGLANLITLQSAQHGGVIAGSITNNAFRVYYDPASR